MTQFSAFALLLLVFVAATFAQSYDDIKWVFISKSGHLTKKCCSTEKRAMRNALVRFGRASGGMRNALVRFGKRSSLDEDDFSAESSLQGKRNGAPQPFGKYSFWCCFCSALCVVFCNFSAVRFGRSGQIDHIHDILSTLQKLQYAGNKWNGMMTASCLSNFWDECINCNWIVSTYLSLFLRLSSFRLVFFSYSSHYLWRRVPFRSLPVYSLITTHIFLLLYALSMNNKGVVNSNSSQSSEIPVKFNNRKFSVVCLITSSNSKIPKNGTNFKIFALVTSHIFRFIHVSGTKTRYYTNITFKTERITWREAGKA